MSRVLLVGGCGFLGLHLIEQFYEETPRPEIHVFDTRPLPTSDGYKFDPAAITVHVRDICSASDIRKALASSRPDVVVHSASPVHGLGPALYRKVNVDGTKNLIKCCKEAGVPALVYTSSAGVVFNGENLFGVDESWPYPQKAMDAYNLTKQQGEVAVLRANDKKFKTVVLRPAGIFGPGDRQMIPALKTMAERGQHRIQLGDNLNLFDVTYVGNVAHAHVLAANALLTNNEAVAGERFFITNDEPIYFWSLAKQIWKHEGYIPKRQYVIPAHIGVVLGYLSQWACALVGKEPTFTAFRVRTATATRYYNIDKAKAVLGYKPKWSLEEALEITLSRMS